MTREWRVMSGDMAGFYVRLADDTANTGGYLLLFSRNFSDPAAEGFDEWYERRGDAEARIGSLDAVPASEEHL